MFRLKLSVIVLAFFILSACGGSSGGSSGSDNSGSEHTNPPVKPTNNAPSISGTPAELVTVGKSYEYIPKANDPDGDTLSFIIQNKPSWLSFNTATGALTGTPTNTDTGVYSEIIITVSDGNKSNSIPAFSITVNQLNSAPIISGTPDTSIVNGSIYSFTPTASDPDGDTLTFSIENKPAWALFSHDDGKLTGISATGIYNDIIISVSDNKGGTTKLPVFSIEVFPVNLKPIISGSPATKISVGSPYSFTPTASDPDEDPLTFSIENRPAWLNFDTATGELTGTPTAKGTHSGITITVTDQKGESATLPAFSIDVTEPYISLYSSSGLLGYTPSTLPYNTSGVTNSTILGASTIEIAKFKLVASGSDFTITSLSAINETNATTPFFKDLADEQLIKDGTEIEFSLVSPLTNGATVTLVFSFTIKETLETFQYRVTLTTN